VPAAATKNIWQKEYALIVAAVREAEGLPARVRKMLSENLASCLGVPKADRHEYMDQVVGMVGEVLDGLEAQAQERLDEAEALAATTRAERDRRASTRSEASEGADAGRQATAERQAALEREAIGRRAAEERLAREEAVRDRHEEARAAKAARRCSISAVLGTEGGGSSSSSSSSSIGPPADGQAQQPPTEGQEQQQQQEHQRPPRCTVVEPEEESDEERRKHAKQLHDLAVACNLDASLVSAVPTAASRRPSLRSTFEVLAMEELGKELQRSGARLDEEILAMDAQRHSHDASVTEARSELSATEARERERKDELEMALEAQKAVEEVVARATAALAKADGEVQEAASVCTSAQLALRELRSGPLDAFKKLRDHEVGPAGSR